jgi:plasmid stability protein
MAQLTIRNVDDAVVQALRRRAAAAGRSTEEEARRSLAMAVGVDREATRARLDAVRAAIAHNDDEPVEQLVRKLRDGRAHDLSG